MINLVFIQKSCGGLRSLIMVQLSWMLTQWVASGGGKITTFVV